MMLRRKASRPRLPEPAPICLASTTFMQEELKRLQAPPVICQHLHRHGCGMRAMRGNASGLCRPCAFFCQHDDKCQAAGAHTTTHALRTPPTYEEKQWVEQVVARGLMFGDWSLDDGRLL